MKISPKLMKTESLMRVECQASSDLRGESREYREREEKGRGGWEIREAFKPWRIIEYRGLMKLESHVKLL